MTVVMNCAQCIHFVNDPQVLEKLMKGLRVMGSGHSSVVSHDGVCSLHDRYLSGNYSCEQFKASLQNDVKS
jgi:hypothetical protein